MDVVHSLRKSSLSRDFHFIPCGRKVYQYKNGITYEMSFVCHLCKALLVLFSTILIIALQGAIETSLHVQIFTNHKQFNNDDPLMSYLLSLCLSISNLSLIHSLTYVLKFILNVVHTYQKIWLNNYNILCHLHYLSM